MKLRLKRKGRTVETPERKPNRAERRAWLRQSEPYKRARRRGRPFRRAFGGWAGAFRPSPWGRG